jgi:NADH-quinone oxidoreductase subunit J
MSDLHPFLFWLIGGLTGLSAIATLVSQNIVRSATWLLFTLGGTAGIFFLLGADFVGATQLLIYVGGTLVLVIFGVMLTAQGPFITMKTGAAEWGVSLIVGLSLYGVLAVSAWDAARSVPPRGLVVGQGRMRGEPANLRYAPAKDLSNDPRTAPYTDVLGLAFLGGGVGPTHLDGNVPVRMNYLLPFEIVSVHLLVVLIGAAYLARAKRRARPAPETGPVPAPAPVLTGNGPSGDGHGH